MPKLSIITINLNNCTGLEQTLGSVFAQTFTGYEYILIDGDSMDGSKALIKKHQNKFVYWESEKDEGIYNAMNKGIKKASGEYLLFLNSGDSLYNNLVLEQIFKNTLNEDLIYGNVLWEPSIPIHNGVFPDTFTFEYFQNYSLPHQATFIKKRLFDTIGLYDENYKIISDWLFFLLAFYKFNCTYHHVNSVVAVCNSKGISFDPDNWDTIVKEKENALQKYFAAFDRDLNTLRTELSSLRSELDFVKRTTGYRTHMMVRNLLKKYLNFKN